jgi:glycosyltransferase involved in cell wall biosynthesis
MNEIRVVMIVRRFWPLAGGEESLLADLSQQLHQLGMSPLILTARFDARWPPEVTCREVPVHRLPFPRRFGWGTMRYMIALSRWLRRNQPDIDLVFVSGLSLDAHAALGALAASTLPVVIRADAGASWVDAGQQKRRLQRVLRRCQTASAIVAPSSSVATQLVDAGFARQRIHLIHDGVPTGAPRSPSSQLAARAALAAVNEDLRVPWNAQVVTWIGRLEAHDALPELVAAWQQISRARPHARLWLIGDGSQREQLFRTVQDADLVGRVLLPGTFDDLDDVLQASDLLVVPSPATNRSLVVLQAMAHRLPVLVAGGGEHDNLVPEGVRGWSVNSSEPSVLAEGILTALCNPDRAETMADAAFEYICQQRSLPAMAHQYYQLFESMIRCSQRTVP